VDRAAWLPVPEARVKILRGQAGFLDRLLAALAGGAGSTEADTRPSN
jgi:predicted NUDIX family NTP pyrophosphohydrolase